MKDLSQEIRRILTDLPRLKFVFPDIEQVRRLDARETSRRRQMVTTAGRAAKSILQLDPDALTDLDPQLLKELSDRIRNAARKNGK